MVFLSIFFEELHEWYLLNNLNSLRRLVGMDKKAYTYFGIRNIGGFRHAEKCVVINNRDACKCYR
jgi:hypothetical protein